ncbi:MAG: GNAT family N-acetyltransferase [Candidatus Woesearchaeota archaeon]
MKLQILKAKIGDAQEIRKLETRIWGEEVVNKYDIPMFVRFGYVFIAKDKNKIVGAICSYKTKKDEVYVCDWVVDEKYRNKNIGSKLYKKLINSVNYPIITFLDPKLITTVRAHEKLGFKLFKRIDNAYGDIGGLEDGARLLVKLENKKRR